jgi:hypothetical protein
VIVGLHTVAELRDWLRALDYQIAEIEAARLEVSPTWLVRDPAGFAAWTAEWSAFRARYADAHNVADGQILLAKIELRPDTLITAEQAWQVVAYALQQEPGGPEHRGDFQELYRRLVAARGANLDFSKTPQPAKGSDVDLILYQGADGLIKHGEAATTAAFPWLVIGGAAAAAWIVARAFR